MTHQVHSGLPIVPGTLDLKGKEASYGNGGERDGRALGIVALAPVTSRQSEATGEHTNEHRRATAPCRFVHLFPCQFQVEVDAIRRSGRKSLPQGISHHDQREKAQRRSFHKPKGT